jgi:glycine/D-amino acid oxidase-like deaminating enzyme
LLEKDFIAGGPTGYSSAIIRQHYSNEVTAKMALKSLQVWRDFDDVVGGECGYTQTGFLIAVRPKDVEGLKANIAFQHSVGIDTRFVSPEEMRELEPHLEPAGLGGGAYEPEGGYCDPATASTAFSKAAQRQGAKVLTGVNVTGIQSEGGRVTGVETSEGFMPAGAVLVAAGPWSAALLRPLGVGSPITVARIKIGIYRRPEDFERHSVFADFIIQAYLRPESGNLMLVGSISPDEAKDVVANPDSFNEKVDMETLAEFAESAAQRYPAMERGHLVNNYASLYDITPDWHSIMDEVPGIEGLYLCAGSSGHGFKLSPAVGEMMANLILNGKQPEDDINLFAFDRFERDELVKGKYEYSIVG